MAVMGRPTEYRPEYKAQVRRLCLLGLTDKEVAVVFDVTEQTINNWKHEHPDFFESMRKGKAQADANVASRLYARAMGYKHDAVKIITVADGQNQGSHVEQVPYVEHYPPDTTAAIFWLKNRNPANWRDKQEVDHTVTELTPEQRTNRVAALLNNAKERAQKATNGNGHHEKG